MATPTRSHSAKRSDLESEFYTMAEAAARCGVSYTTVWEAVQRGDFPVPPVRIGRQWRFSKWAIDRLAEAGLPSHDDGDDAA